MLAPALGTNDSLSNTKEIRSTYILFQYDYSLLARSSLIFIDAIIFVICFPK